MCCIQFILTYSRWPDSYCMVCVFINPFWVSSGLLVPFVAWLPVGNRIMSEIHSDNACSRRYGHGHDVYKT